MGFHHLNLVPWITEHMHLKKTHKVLYCTTCIMFIVLYAALRKNILFIQYIAIYCLQYIVL